MLSLVAVVSLTAVAPFAPLDAHPLEDVVPGRALVHLEPAAANDADARARSGREGIRFVRRSVLGWVEVALDPSLATDAVARLRLEGHLAAPVTRARTLGGSSDPKASQQRLEVIHVDDAWEVTIGAGQRIGVVDTGLVRAHEDIAGVDADGFDFITDAAVAVDGDGRDADYSEVLPDVVTELMLAHGTHVAGAIAAPGDNAAGIAGINWRAEVVSARAITTEAGGLSTDILEAAYWLSGGEVEGVPSIEPVDVINMSLGIRSACDDYTQSVIDDIVGRGVVVVAAVGNHGDGFGTTDDAVLAPASCRGVIAVGAVDHDLRKTAYTNDDGTIDIFAPGGTFTEGVLSLGAATNAYVGQQGTSMATPHVTGVVSLMLALDPSLTPAEVKAILVDLPSTCTGCDGKPMLDAALALARVTPTDVNAGGGCASTRAPPLFVALGVLALGRMRRRHALSDHPRRPGPRRAV